MKIKAKFKGSDSLGYVNGQNYTLRFNVQYGKVIIRRDSIAPEDGLCLYDSLKSFLNNWQVF